MNVPKHLSFVSVSLTLAVLCLLIFSVVKLVFDARPTSWSSIPRKSPIAYSIHGLIEATRTKKSKVSNTAVLTHGRISDKYDHGSMIIVKSENGEALLGVFVGTERLANISRLRIGSKVKLKAVITRILTEDSILWLPAKKKELKPFVGTPLLQIFEIEVE